MGFLSKIWKGIKKVAGAVAMIAAPFIAGPIAGMIGASGALGTALVGAGLGGLGAGAAGINPLVGAALGGLGGFAAGGGAAAGGGGGGLFGGLFSGAAPGSTASILGTTGATVAPAVTATAAPAAAGGFFSGLNIGNLAPLAFAMYGKGPQNLTAVEQQNVIDNARNAAVERGVFDEQLAGSRALLQQGEARPEQAYATAKMATERGLRDAERSAGLAGRPGLRDAERRRASIEGTRIGTAAVTGEQARAAQATAAGLSALPTSVPTSASELNKTIYADVYKRKSDYMKDLAGGFGQMYGSDDRDIA
jgi:hypothetical protein